MFIRTPTARLRGYNIGIITRSCYYYYMMQTRVVCTYRMSLEDLSVSNNSASSEKDIPSVNKGNPVLFFIFFFYDFRDKN